MRFKDDFIEQVRDATNIVELIGQHVQLQKSGASFRGLCPFPGHGERTPSFFVSDSKQLYHCFGCKKSGTAYNFLMDFQGLSFPEAVEALANRAGIAMPEPERKAFKETHDSSKEEKNLALKLNRYVGAHFQKNLQGQKPGSVVLNYIAKRGLTSEILEEFKIGYAQPGWDELVLTLKKGRAPLPAAEKLGLVKKKASGDYFDILRDRLIFPIISANGDVLGFGGRSLGDQQPKYLNSPETVLFHKGKTFYGLHTTAKYIRAQDEAYIVEGYMDLIALYQFGIKNVVATLGTAFTSDHAKLLKRLCSRVVVLFDGDDAGQMAAEKSLPFLLDANLLSRCLILPNEDDPDDFLRKEGADKLIKLSQNAPDHFLSFLGRQLQGYGGRPTEKVSVLNKIAPVLGRVRDQRLRMLYLQEVSDRLGVTPRWLEEQIKAAPAQAIEIKEKNVFSTSDEKIPKEETILVRFMLQRPAYLERVRSSGIVDLFASETARKVAQRIIERYCQNPNDFDKLAASIISLEPGEAHFKLLLTGHVDGVVSRDEIDEQSEAQLIHDCMARVKERDFKIKSKTILNSLKSGFSGTGDNSSEKLEALMKMAQKQKGPRKDI